MAPSAMHESNARGALELVQALCECGGLAVVPMGAAAARTSDRSASADPDESFFIGPRAERFLAIMRVHGRDAAVSEMEDVPRDLVIEVEHSRRDPDKRGIYRNAGVAELWEIATSEAGRAPTIWDLQTQAAPTATPTSRLLPRVRADALPTAMVELQRIGGLTGLVRGMERGEPVDQSLMASAGIAKRPGSGTKPAHRRPRSPS